MMIHVVIGTRAQLIKMAPLMSQLENEGIDYNFIFMAQHKETIYEMLEQFEVKKPDYVIGDIGKDIVKTSQMIPWSLKVLWHGLLHRKSLFRNDKDGIVLIHGDAPPLLLGGIIAKFGGLDVGQVEAGLRSFNFFKPFPEELTRVLATKLGLVDRFYCQDEMAAENIRKMLVFKKNKVILNTEGNTMIDALTIGELKNKGKKNDFTQFDRYGMVTVHRFETLTNIERMEYIVSKLIDISKKTPLIFIMHPPTKEMLTSSGLIKRFEEVDSIQLIPRVDFFVFNRLFVNSEFIVSDGGSNQEESAYLGIPCLLFRTETERQEGLNKNVVISEFKDEVIDRFVESYTNYRIRTKLEGQTPTERILSDLLGDTVHG